MKDRGKAVEVFNSSNEFFQDYSCSSDVPCKKHPQSSSVGICAYCLKDRLVKLVCSDCGEQRLSSCSCSDLSSNRNSCTVEVGSVGRVSFLIENDKQNEVLNQNNPNSKPITKSSGTAGEKPAPEEVILLKRSNSSCVEIKKKNGLWRIGRLFRKSKRENSKDCGKSVGGCDEKSDLWVVDYMGVSRSRSLCSFRGGGFFGSEDGCDVMSYSGARSSISAARSSGVNAGLPFDPERRSGFSEAEPRKSGFESEKRDSSVVESEFGNDYNKNANRRVFSLKESYFTGGEDSGFIDLKFDFSSESKGDHYHHHHHHHQQIPAMKMGILSDSNSVFGSMRGSDFGSHDQWGGGLVGDGMFSHGGSCRITVNDRGIKKSRKSFKGWRWIFRHHPNWISGRKKDHEDNVIVNP
ncbi:Micronuclear linker histone polyprotein-like protein [Melia azedarach]|uniref:Micronuclear linker histone polyprotein-like protein n=1 Tax=Melia azedarach TaxID=155640 RepID=A0ACC1XGW5_MELAZ|nr:Micronuclear linker histone polyprotein-like protein [Melia azedarach]